MTAASPIDRTHLASFTGGDPELDMDLIRSFAEKTEGYLLALSQSKGENWKDMAHKIKGAARAIGAFEMGDLAEKAEHLPASDAKDPILNSLRKALNDIRIYAENSTKEQN